MRIYEIIATLGPASDAEVALDAHDPVAVDA